MKMDKNPIPLLTQKITKKIEREQEFYEFLKKNKIIEVK